MREIVTEIAKARVKLLTGAELRSIAVELYEEYFSDCNDEELVQIAKVYGVKYSGEALDNQGTGV